MKITLGTRRSDLARWQAHHAAELIRAAAPEAEVALKFITTLGDRDRKSDIGAMGGIGVFTKESEDALLAGEVDLVVHSLKDLPTRLAPGLVLAAVPEREDPRDALVGVTLKDLKPGLRIGTGSVRRKAQLLAIEPGLDIRPLRGNVPPRLRKAKTQDGIDATLLAASGLARLGLTEEADEILAPEVFPYAPGQGALGLEAREGDAELIRMLRKIEHAPTRAGVDAERALLLRLEAGCSLPVGVMTQTGGGRLSLRATVTAVDGRERIAGAVEGPVGDAERLGTSLADSLLAKGARRLLDEVYAGRAAQGTAPAPN